jgi:hypothetical protein
MKREIKKELRADVRGAPRLIEIASPVKLTLAQWLLVQLLALHQQLP